VEIRSERATSPFVAPRDFDETELALRVALESSDSH
jgi:hypothetical protein